MKKYNSNVIIYISCFLTVSLILCNNLTYGARSDVEAFVTRFYQQCLGRVPDQAGLTGWVNALTAGTLSGADVANGFILSDEFINRYTTNEDFVTILYRAFFDREPDAAGYSGWLTNLYGGNSRAEVLNGFVSSQEFNNLCDRYGISPTSGSSSGAVDTDESDPCGNVIGNGNEIVFGQVTPTEWNPDNPFRSLAVHPNNPDIVIIGTEANGFVKSIDGGQTWARFRYGLRHSVASGEQLYPEVYDLAFSESNPDIIYAATTGGPGPLAGPDGGDGGIYKSTDGGKTWERKNCGLDNGWIHSVYISPDNPDLAVIGISGGEASGSWGGIQVGDYFDGGIFRTIDGGENWTRVNLTANDNKNKFQYIRSQRNAPSVLYTFGFNWEGTSPNIGFYKSTDAGETWDSFATVLRDRNITYFDISDNGEVIYAVDEMKILKSTDSGETWSEYDLHSSGYVVSVFPGDSEKLLFSKVDGVYLSEDGLLTETKVIDVKGRHPSDIAIAPSDSNIVYAIDIGYDVYKSVDGGRTFTKLVNLREDVFNVIP